MTSNTPIPKVYRLRGCPAYADPLQAVKIICRALGDMTPTDIRLQSLATSLDPWAKPKSKVATLILATLMFYKCPGLIESRSKQDEWEVPLNGSPTLIMDTHLLGMTPLNDVVNDEHDFDCIATSGSHPFGSWQPGGPDKTYMWLRDAIPRIIPNARVVIYGYDSVLAKSNSFQRIQDLVSAFIHHLKASGWVIPSAKPLRFLAHSLGGIVVKEAFTVLAEGGDEDKHILNRFLGGVLFGVPNGGMLISHLLAMVEGQVNEQMINDLSENSEYLRSLDDRFAGLSSIRDMHLVWAYETKTSPTVVRQPDGSFARTGPEQRLVTQDSATRGLYNSQSSAIFPINANHSEMVKFRAGDPIINVVANNLRHVKERPDIKHINRTIQPTRGTTEGARQTRDKNNNR
ncbi:hypothetical protein F4778DRAFT_593886 [Xylariomycetidae sp. FL2044]|nr:hypothetical protein F4778DRAFT_593886 [Xylariomycetidae sp. FL2044]